MRAQQLVVDSYGGNIEILVDKHADCRTTYIHVFQYFTTSVWQVRMQVRNKWQVVNKSILFGIIFFLSITSCQRQLPVPLLITLLWKQPILISVFCGNPSYSTAERVKSELMCRKPKRSKMCSMQTDRKFFPGWCEFGRFQQQHKCQVLGVFPRGLGAHRIPYKCRPLSETRFSCCFVQHVHILDWA